MKRREFITLLVGAAATSPSRLATSSSPVTHLKFVEPANLTVHISALRRTLRNGRDGNRFIINVPGRGYTFVASVEVSGSMPT